MPRLLWDQVGSKVYETGVDRGVLYLQSGMGVPWNGLTSVQETSSESKMSSFVLEQEKFLTQRHNGEYSAIVKAYTYPLEFLEYEGYGTPETGMYLDEQPVYNTFGLSYRTLIADDVTGINSGYKIHVLYNLCATPTPVEHKTQNENIDAIDFSWDISGIPELFDDYIPFVHVVIDSRKISTSALIAIENKLYGTSTTSAYLPNLLDLFVSMTRIVDNGDGTWTITGPSDVIEYLNATTAKLSSDKVVSIDSDRYMLS